MTVEFGLSCGYRYPPDYRASFSRDTDIQLMLSIAIFICVDASAVYFYAKFGTLLLSNIFVPIWEAKIRDHCCFWLHHRSIVGIPRKAAFKNATSSLNAIYYNLCIE